MIDLAFFLSLSGAIALAALAIKVSYGQRQRITVAQRMRHRI